jgi:hypothetical protein
MSRIKSALVKASSVLALAVALGAAPWPQLVTGRVDEALSACWRAAGDRLADRELDAIARQLVRDRQDVEHLEALRGRLAEHRRALAEHRRLLIAPGAEPARLDAALARLDSTSGRADRLLDRVRGDIRAREGELIALRAAVDACRVDRELAAPFGNPSSWFTRVARVRQYLRPGPSESDEPGTQAELSALP